MFLMALVMEMFSMHMHKLSNIKQSNTIKFYVFLL